MHIKALPMIMIRYTLLSVLSLCLWTSPSYAQRETRSTEKPHSSNMNYNSVRDLKRVERTKKAKKKKRTRMTPAQVRAANAKTMQSMEKNLPKRSFTWGSIVLHHTASEWSSVARIDAYHRTKFKDPDGIEYHFLIGNGKRAPDGLIEYGRWPKQKRSIHLFKPDGWPTSITISMVGNLHERKIKPAQYEALLDLVWTLSQTHNIPIERISTHTRIDGRLTVCPGKHFPYKRLIADVKKRQAALAAAQKNN